MQVHSTAGRHRGGLVFKTHRLVYHSTLGLRVIKKKKGRHQFPLVAHSLDVLRLLLHLLKRSGVGGLQGLGVIGVRGSRG